MDEGAQFTAQFLRQLMGLLEVQLRLSTLYHPQSNGQMEQVNQILEQYLHCYIN